jgi:hypothetical protein
LKKRTRFESVVESLVNRENDLRGGCGGGFLLGLRSGLRAGNEICGSAKIRDQLADGRSGGGTREDDRVVQPAG